MLAVVVLPRRRGSELSTVVPQWSRLAFGAMATAVLAGALLLLFLSPRWTALPGSSYGRFLIVKLLLVAVLLHAASRSRDFVARRLPALGAAAGTDSDQTVLVGAAALPAGRPRNPAPPPLDAVALRPFVSAVTAELCIAASILAAAAALVGRAPPA